MTELMQSSTPSWRQPQSNQEKKAKYTFPVGHQSLIFDYSGPVPTVTTVIIADNEEELLCDGSMLWICDYPQLSEVLGDRYKCPNAVNRFYLPYRPKRSFSGTKLMGAVRRFSKKRLNGVELCWVAPGIVKAEAFSANPSIEES